MFLKPHACAAYFLDARYRADLLTAPKVRATVPYLLEVAWSLFGEGEAPIEHGYGHGEVGVRKYRSSFCE